MQLNDLREQFKDNPDLGREIQDLSRDLSRAGETCFEIGVVQSGERGVEWVGSP